MAGGEDECELREQVAETAGGAAGEDAVSAGERAPGGAFEHYPLACAAGADREGVGKGYAATGRAGGHCTDCQR